MHSILFVDGNIVVTVVVVVINLMLCGSKATY
jgi:hypothetical protein